MNRTISILCTLLLIFSIAPTFASAQSSSSFKDVPDHFWAKNEIEYLVEKGIIRGYPDGTFKPNHSVSHIQVLEMLMKSLNYPILDSYPDHGYSNYPKGTYGYDILASAVHHGLIYYGNNSIFNVFQATTRHQMANKLTKAFKLSRMWEEDFVDASKGTSYYVAAETLAAYGITKPYEGNLFKPNNHLTRAQFAAFLYRTLTLEDIIKNPEYEFQPFDKSIEYKGIEINVGKLQETNRDEYYVSYEAPVEIINYTDKPLNDASFKLQYENYPNVSIFDLETYLVRPYSSREINIKFIITADMDKEFGKPKFLEFAFVDMADALFFYELMEDSLKWKIN